MLLVSTTSANGFAHDQKVRGVAYIGAMAPVAHRRQRSRRRGNHCFERHHSFEVAESTLDDVANNLARRSLALAAQANLSLQSLSLVLDSVSEHVAPERIVSQDQFKLRMGNSETHRLLNEKIVGLPQIDFIGLIDRDGNVVSSSRVWPVVPEINVADRDYFQALQANPALKIFISAPFQNRGTGAWNIVVARRLNDAQDQFIGLINGSVNLKFFEDHWRSILVQEVDSSISLNRLDGTVLARIPSADAVGRRFEDGVQNQLRDVPAVVLRKLSPIDNTMRIEAAHVLGDFPLFILATQIETSALQGWSHIAGVVSVISAVCVVVVLIAAYGMGRWWREQEHRLRLQSEKLEAENAKLIAEGESRRNSEGKLQAARLTRRSRICRRAC